MLGAFEVKRDMWRLALLQPPPVNIKASPSPASYTQGLAGPKVTELLKILSKVKFWLTISSHGNAD